MINNNSLKNFSRCSRFFSLYKKTGYEKRKSKIDDILNEMMSVIGSSLEKNDEFEEILLGQYKSILELTARMVLEKFGGNITYSDHIKDQNHFIGLFSKTYLECDTDVYNENEDKINIIEVSPVTTNKFLSCKYDYNQVSYPIFCVDQDDILKLKEEINSYDISLEPRMDKYKEQKRHLLDQNHSVGKKIYDLAIKRFIIEHSKEFNRDKNYSYYFAVLNKDYIYDGYKEFDKEVYKHNELMMLVDVTRLTEAFQPIITQDVLRTLKYIEDCQETSVSFNPMCKLNTNEQCQYLFHCFPELESNESLLNLVYKQSNIQYKGKSKYHDVLADGIFKITDLEKSCYSVNNQIQYDCLITNETHLLKEKILFGLEHFKLPRAYLDFETYPSPLPLNKGESPYTQSVFQYSLHIEKDEGVLDKDVDNYSFLCDGKRDSRKELTLSLINRLKENKVNSIIAYNASFEKNVLKNLGKLYPEYQADINEMINKIVDLMDIVKNNKAFYSKMGYSKDLELNNYYQNNLKGSYSLKVVLPSIAGISYEHLDVKNGSQAYTLYSVLKKLNPDDFNKAYNALIEYCKLDTFSLFKIIQKLKVMCENS